MKKEKNILLWILTVFILLAALVYMPSAASVLMLIFVAIALPVQRVREFWKSVRVTGALKAVLLVVLFLSGCYFAPTNRDQSNDNPDPAPPVNSDQIEAPKENHDARDLVEVAFDISMQGEAGRPSFTIKTNLPDETELLLTVNGDNGSKFQDKVIIKDGTAESVQFGSESNFVPDKFSLHVSMSLPSLQSDAVRATIGEKGEYISGQYVKNSSFGDENIISAIFDYDFSNNDGNSTKETFIEAPSLPPELAASAPTSGGSGNNFNTYSNPSQQQTSSSYVLNTSTKKFHYPSCDSVEKISPDNYATSSSSRESLIAQGYDPCGNCHP